jgi:hypothetical protein
MFQSIKNVLSQVFPSSQFPLSDEVETEIPIKDDLIILVTHRPLQNKNLPITADLNCLLAFNLLKFYKCEFELDTEGVPDMATLPDLQLPFIITKISPKTFSSAYDYLTELSIMKEKALYQQSLDYLALKFSIEKYCYDAFYRWLWNDSNIYRDFTLDYYSYRYHPLVRKYHMRRIFGKYFTRKHYTDKVS